MIEWKGGASHGYLGSPSRFRRDSVRRGTMECAKENIELLPSLMACWLVSGLGPLHSLTALLAFCCLQARCSCRTRGCERAEACSGRSMQWVDSICDLGWGPIGAGGEAGAFDGELGTGTRVLTAEDVTLQARMGFLLFTPQPLVIRIRQCGVVDNTR